MRSRFKEMTMANTDDTSKKQPASNSGDVSAETSKLQQTLEAERARLIQAHSVVHCLYEVLLYADSEEAVTYAEAAHLAAMLIDDVVVQLDPVRIKPLIEAVQRSARLQGRYDIPEPRGLRLGNKDDDDAVREPSVLSFNRH
jgi:hypothetical protein